jgi:hypothetical protein
MSFDFSNLYNALRSAGITFDGARPSRFILVLWYPIFGTRSARGSAKRSSEASNSFLNTVKEAAYIGGQVLGAGTSVIKTARTVLQCKGAQLPQSTIQEIAVPIPGNQKVKLAGDRQFEEQLSLQLYNDEDFTIRNSLENWMKNIQDNETGVSDLNKKDSMPDEYKSTAILIQLGGRKLTPKAAAIAGAGVGLSAGNGFGGKIGGGIAGAATGAAAGLVADALGVNIPMPVYSYTFHGVFPSVIGAVDLNWETTDQIEEFQLNLSYDYFDIDLNPQNFLTNF